MVARVRLPPWPSMRGTIMVTDLTARIVPVARTERRGAVAAAYRAAPQRATAESETAAKTCDRIDQQNNDMKRLDAVNRTNVGCKTPSSVRLFEARLCFNDLG